MTYGLGIDIGADHTVWATVSRQGDTSQNIDGASVESVVALRQGRLVAGTELTDDHQPPPTHVTRGFVPRLGEATPIMVGGTPYGAESLIASVLASVVAQARKRNGGEPAVVVLVHDDDLGEYRTGLLTEAARVAGVPVANLMLVTRSETTAALASEKSLKFAAVLGPAVGASLLGWARLPDAVTAASAGSDAGAAAGGVALGATGAALGASALSGGSAAAPAIGPAGTPLATAGPTGTPLTPTAGPTGTPLTPTAGPAGTPLTPTAGPAGTPLTPTAEPPAATPPSTEPPVDTTEAPVDTPPSTEPPAETPVVSVEVAGFQPSTIDTRKLIAIGVSALAVIVAVFVVANAGDADPRSTSPGTETSGGDVTIENTSAGVTISTTTPATSPTTATATSPTSAPSSAPATSPATSPTTAVATTTTQPPDTTKPVASSPGNAPSEIYDSSEPPSCPKTSTLTVTATDNVAVTQVTGTYSGVGGSPKSFSKGGGNTWSATFGSFSGLALMSSQNITITIVARDAAGNTSTSVQTSVTVKGPGLCVI